MHTLVRSRKNRKIADAAGMPRAVKSIMEEYVVNIQENEVWLCIVALAMLVLLVFFGLLLSGRRARKQTKVLRRIDEKLENMIAANENADKTRERLAKDVAAIRVNRQMPADKAPDAQVMEHFFEETMIEEAPAAEPTEMPEAAPKSDSAAAAQSDSATESIAGSFARGKSGRLYTREELVSQIRE